MGDEVVKTTTIESIAFKTGTTGPLAFVTVRHRYDVGGALALDERQDIVYRTPSGEAAKPTTAALADIRTTFAVRPRHSCFVIQR